MRWDAPIRLGQVRCVGAAHHAVLSEMQVRMNRSRYDIQIQRNSDADTKHCIITKTKDKGKKEEEKPCQCISPFPSPSRRQDYELPQIPQHIMDHSCLLLSLYMYSQFNAMVFKVILLLLDKIYQLFPTLLLDETNKHTSRINHVCRKTRCSFIHL